MAIGCLKCGGELGLRERYERLLRLLEASLVIYDLNQKFEESPSDQLVTKAILEASVQLHKVIGEYWLDIPGDTLKAKLDNVAAKYQDDGSLKETESGIIT